MRDDLPLKQFLVCENCKRRMIGYTHSNGEGWDFCRYACKTKGCCKSILSDDMHILFKKQLDRLEVDEGTINIFAEIFLKYSKAGEMDHLKEKEMMGNRLRELKSELEQTLGIISKLKEPTVINRFKKKIVELEIEVERTNNNLVNITEPENYERLFEESRKLLENPLQNWESGILQNKIKYQKWLFPSGVLYTQNQRLRTPEKCLTYKVLDRFKGRRRKNYARDDSNV